MQQTSRSWRFVERTAGKPSNVLWVMYTARASRDHSKKSTLSGRIRLREKRLQAKFCRRRGQGIHAVLTAVPLTSSVFQTNPKPDPPNSGRSEASGRLSRASCRP